MSLDAFFADMRPFLLGELTAGELEARHGPSASGTDNLAFYQPFLRRHERQNLQRLFPAVAALCRRLQGLDWEELCADFVRAHVPAHWSLHRAGEPFSSWLQQQIDADRPVPLECPALADYAWTRWLANNAPLDGPVIDGRVFVRRYAFDVAAVTKLLIKDADAEVPETPQAALVIYRSLKTQRVELRVPTLATLAVLDQLGGGDTDWAAYGVTDEVVAAEHQVLAGAGVIEA